jgi:phosphatidylglycerophosphatase A
VKRKIVEFLATGFYLGKIRPAPGTWGTFLGIPIAYALTFGSHFSYMLGSILLLAFAVAIAEMYEVITGHHDTSEIVIDEVVGYVIAMTWLPATWQFFAAAFVVFRFFDILKPYPINIMDQKIRGGLGTILDDVAAGLVSNLVLQLIYVNTNWLGTQWNGTTFN